MTDINRYTRRPRKAIWLQIDEYKSVLSAKEFFENEIGPAQWGTFMTFLVGVYMGSSRFLDTLKRIEKDDK